MHDFKPGFRLSATDILVLFLSIVVCFFSYDISPIITAVVGCVVLHFFLFCNVIRMSRIPELVWAAVFLTTVGSSLSLDKPILLMLAFSISLLTTLILVYLELRKPSYHGVLWQKINPLLLQWFEQNRSK